MLLDFSATIFSLALPEIVKELLSLIFLRSKGVLCEPSILLVAAAQNTFRTMLHKILVAAALFSAEATSLTNLRGGQVRLEPRCAPAASL